MFQIDEHTLERMSDCLSCRRFPGSHTYDKIAKLLNHILDVYNIKMEKVLKGTCDNGTNFLKAFYAYSAKDEEEEEDQVEEEDESIGDDVNDITMECLEQVLVCEKVNEQITMPRCHPCTSHTLSLICTSQDVCNRGNRVQRKVFSKCHAFWNCLCRSVQKNEAVFKITNKSIVTPVVTRWNSLYDSISCLLSLESDLSSAFLAASELLKYALSYNIS